MRNILLTALFVGAFLFGGCNKNDKKENNPSPEVKEVTLNTSSFKDWKYFSFTTGKEVQVTDAKNDLNWDIAFNRSTIRLNGGTSGMGKGEALKTNSKDFDAVKSAPATGYTKDAEHTVTAGMPPNTRQVQVSFNAVISGNVKSDSEQEPSGFVTYDPAQMGVGGSIYTLNKWVYIIKNADGKFVKIQFIDYLNEKGKGGYPKFKYQLSANDKF